MIKRAWPAFFRLVACWILPPLIFQLREKTGSYVEISAPVFLLDEKQNSISTLLNTVNLNIDGYQGTTAGRRGGAL
ncbi:hypothetical protein EV356DRAFT_162579 [Viridothelium virens]|uniref:Uncharacterized protein n=1 Tax=Viridothelium virens TaxID=1048519 RepID=A0A6A6HLS7_VIRVR|nr:hypothetical protein EV356DRAFT_162579 [Viridothelium virens]